MSPDRPSEAHETLEASDVGLQPGDPLPFVFRSGARPSPLIVSFPHVGLEWPDELGPRPQVSFPRNADFAVDRLYVRAEALGAATLRARYSRLVVDLNRAGDDVSPELVPDHPAPRPRPSLSSAVVGGSRRPIRNRGVVWPSAVGNIPLFTTLTHAQFARRIARYHAPYHRALRTLIDRRLARFGRAIVLDAHSMPGTVAGDLVLGTRDGQACSTGIRDLAVDSLAGHAQQIRARWPDPWPLSLAIDDPYKGGHIAATFGQPTAGVHALQLEVSRALYMDEYRLDLAPVPDPIEVGPNRPPAARSPGRRTTRPPQSTRDQRRLAALVCAVDSLVSSLADVAAAGAAGP